jgi:4-amino-4-deoxy-L-arabinose transferase-like glycosyltransferase
VGSLALILAIAGQFALAVSPDWLAWGLALNALAIVLFIWVSRHTSSTGLERVVKRLGISHRVVLIGTAAILSILAALWSVIYEQLGRTNYVPVLMLLATSALLYLGAFANGALLAPGWRERLAERRTELILLSLITAAAAAVRFYKLGEIPRVIDGDEGLLGQAALLTRQLPLANPFSLFENFGGLYMQGIGLALQTFGRSPWALRLLPAIGGTLAAPALYLLGRQLFGYRVGLMAALLLALSHPHIHFSRTVAVGYIQSTWILTLILYLFISAIEQRSLLRAACGGLLLGIDFSVYIGAQIATAFLVVYIVVAAVACRPLIQNAARPLVAFWFGVVLTVLPQAVYSWRHPEQFFARLNTDGTLQSGWLARQVADTGQSAVQILFGRVAHAFLSLNYYPALDFYGAGVPLLELITGALFLLGLGYALMKTRDHRYLLLNGYFWALTLAVGLFAVPPAADSYRMLVALPSAVLLAAVGWEQLLAVIGPETTGLRVARPVLYAFLVIAVAGVNLRTYFTDFAGQCRFGGDPQTRFASYLGNYLRTLDAEAEVYLLSTSEIRYGTHSSVDFLSSGRAVTNVDDPAASLPVGSNQVIIAVADRAQELRAWANENGNGTLQSVNDCQRPMLLAYHMP